MKHATTSRFLIWISVLVFCGSCRLRSKSIDGFGLEVFEIEVPAENFSVLNSTVRAKVPVGATGRFRGNDYRFKINYAGKSTIDAFKKSYHLEFDRPKIFLGRTQFRLSAQIVDKSMLRSLVGFPTFSKLGFPTPKVIPVSLYVNRNFAGLYMLIEYIDEEFLDVRSIAAKTMYKAILNNARFNPKTLRNTDQAFSSRTKPKTFTDLKQFIELVNKEDSEENRQKIEKRLDLENYYKYIAACAYLHNWDGISNNFFMYRETSSNKFRFIPWDLDRIIEINAEKEKKEFFPGESIYGGNNLSAKIFSVKERKLAYLKTLESFLSDYPLDEFLSQIEEHADFIEQAYAADRTLNKNPSSFEEEKQRLVEGIKLWHESVKSDLIAEQKTL